MARMERILSRIEAMGLRGAEDHWSMMPPELAKRCRAQSARIGDALATLMPTSDSLRVNRVVGLGHRQRVDAATIDEMIQRYRAARIKRFSVMPSPGPHAAGLARRLAARGFTRKPGLVLLLRDCRKPVLRPASSLRVVREGPALHRAAIEILHESFPSPPSRLAWALSARARDRYEHFIAFDSLRAVAVASLRIEGDLAWLGGAATRTRWRRRGGQGALIATRLRRAARRGCRWAWSETMEPIRGRPAASRRNLIRHGFVQVGRKPRFVWEER